MAVRDRLCEDQGDLREVLASFTAFLRDTRGWFDSYGGFTVDAEEPWPAEFNDAALAIVDAARGVPPTSVTPEGGLELEGEVFFDPTQPDTCAARASESAGRATDCVAVLEEFATYYNYAQQTYAADGALAFARYAALLQEDWERYLDTARSQTLLELTINSALYRRTEDARFDPPPNRQLIVLHPNLVMEFVDGAESGQKLKEALMVEIIGVNYWRQERWYLPSGASVMTVYSDRADVNDWGYGVSLHFANLYTLGVSRRSGDAGVFLSIDLLKLVEDRRTVLEHFGR
ncbi:hypothetical protein [Aquisalimonas sp.]|uniref:hypothetical protein n=1 Tax=Aquisalimonas sp. TaxID=1872621 RepID=UPI0025C32AD9|nr:hypothetical protein [Aquisalimonas sp.]